MSRGLRFDEAVVAKQLARFATKPPRGATKQPKLNPKPRYRLKLGQKRNLEQDFALQLDAAGMTYKREWRFASGRRWKFDFYIYNAEFVRQPLAVEIEGGIKVDPKSGKAYSFGRHITGVGFLGDAEKYNEAAILGWRVLRVCESHIDSGQALEWVKRAIEQK